MQSSLFLPLLSLLLAVLPTVFCAPHLIFQTRFGVDEDRPFLAVTEAERHNSVKGATLEINGFEVGSVTPEKNYVTFNLPSYFETEDDVNEDLIPGQTSTGTGQLVYWPFRLDHNTVYDDNGVAVEDNGWVFSFRINWQLWDNDDLDYYDDCDEECTRADQYNTGWQVLFSFPTVDTIMGVDGENVYGTGNVIIAVRMRDDQDELGVFLASDPTLLNPVGFEQTNINIGYPHAVFIIGSDDDGNRIFSEERQENFESYVLFVPMPERVDNSITISFTAPFDSIPTGEDTYFEGPDGDWVIEWGATATQTSLKSGMEELIDELVSKAYYPYSDFYDVDEIESASGLFAPSSTDDAPTTEDDYALYEYEIEWDMVPTFSVPNGDYQLTITFPNIWPGAGLLVREFQSKFLQWVPEYLEEETGFLDINVVSHVPGQVRSEDITLWWEGQVLNQYTDYKPSLALAHAYFRISDGVLEDEDMYDEFWDDLPNDLFDTGAASWNVNPPGDTDELEFAFRGDADDGGLEFYAISIDDTWGSTFAYAFKVEDLDSDWCSNDEYANGSPSSGYKTYTDLHKAAALLFEEKAQQWSSLSNTWDLDSFQPNDLPIGFNSFNSDDDNDPDTWLNAGYINRHHFDIDFFRAINGDDDCNIMLVARLRDPSEEIGLWVQTNTDADSNVDQATLETRKRQADAGTNGPLIIIGGHPKSVSGDTLQDFRGAFIGGSIADIKFFTVVGQDAASAVSESFLATLVECGDGQLDEGEQCDSSDSTCFLDCTCPERSIPMAPFGCTFCGNGVIDYLKGEVCDYTEDPNCADDCMGCREEGMILDEEELNSNDGDAERKGRCTFCGNGVLDVTAGELCDSASDEHCLDDCSGCATGATAQEKWFPVGNEEGTCNQCGNGLVDAGEVCDIAFQDHVCSSDCTTCHDGWIPVGDGRCTQCGNGVVDDGEACDPSLTACQANCSACLNEGEDEIHVSRNGICTRCGNGFIDGGEVCDPGTSENSPCAEDCSGCDSPYVPANDRLGSCTLCGNGVVDRDNQEVCDSDPNCVDCSDCRAPYVVSQGGVCVLCGNGLLDAGEVCDSLQEGCSSSCLACAEFYNAWPDMEQNPNGLCYPTSCETAPSEDGECTCDE